MTPKLLLALALVGAMQAGEPAVPVKATTAPATPDKTFAAPFGNSPDRVYTFSAAMKGKIVVHREPTVTRKADGTWEISFAEKASLPALTVTMTPEMIAASNILPPAPVTVLWPNEVWQAEADKRTLDNPHSLNWAQKFTVEVSGKRYEFGLRSDGCVVWRERK